MDLVRGLPQFLQENAEIVPRVGHDRFLPNFLRVANFLIVLPFDVV
jgi:hypothetical protein